MSCCVLDLYDNETYGYDTCLLGIALQQMRLFLEMKLLYTFCKFL
jgi:hypothetical protein